MIGADLAHMRMLQPRPGDAGDIVVGWLLKLVVAFAVLGVLAFDGVSLGIGELAVSDAAAAASRAAAQEIGAGGTSQQAYDAAGAAAAADDAASALSPGGFVVSADDVSVTLSRSSSTLVLHYIPRSDGWFVAEATSTHPVQ